MQMAKNHLCIPSSAITSSRMSKNDVLPCISTGQQGHGHRIIHFPSNIQDRNDTYCHYLMGLAYIGLKEYEKAENELHEILKEQPGYQGAIQHLMMI